MIPPTNDISRRSPAPILRAVLATIALMLAIVPGGAADHDTCLYYASQAMQDARDNTNMAGKVVLGSLFGGGFLGIDPGSPIPERCGYSGPQWSLNYDDHYNWCRGQSEAAVNAAMEQRLNEVRYCFMCASYVNGAFRVRKLAKDSFCPAPSTADADAMFKSCMAGDHSDLQNKHDQLKNDLETSIRAVDTCKQRLRNISSTTPEGQIRSKRLESVGNSTETPEGQIRSKRLKRIGDSVDAKPCLNCGSTSSDNTNPLRSGKPSPVPAAGLLEGDSGFSTQGPVSSGPRAPGASLPSRISR